MLNLQPLVGFFIFILIVASLPRIRGRPTDPKKSAATSEPLTPLPPLPAGWTQERIYATNRQERNKLLNKEQVQMIDVYVDELQRRWEAENESSDDDTVHPGPAPPLPPGWTSKGYDKINWIQERRTGEIQHSMPPEEWNMLETYRPWVVKYRTYRAIQEEKAPRQPDQEQQRLAAKYKFENYWNGSSYGKFTDIARILDRQDLNGFGFIIFKTWGYAADERQLWEDFWKHWLAYFDQRMREMGAVGDVRSEGLASLLTWQVVDDESLQGASIETIRTRFDAMCARKEVSFEVDYDLALLPDQQLARDLAVDKSGGQKLAVLGIDVDEPGPSNEQELRERLGVGNDPTIELDHYLGHFKIRLDELIPEAWMALQEKEPGEMYPGVDSIWTGPDKPHQTTFTGEVYFRTIQSAPGCEILVRPP